MDNRIRLYLALDFLLLLIGLFGLFRLMRHPAAPFESTQFLDHLVVTSTKVPDLVFEGVTILRMDGVEIHSRGDAQFVLDAKEAGEVLTVDGFLENLSWTTQVPLEASHSFRYVLLTGFVSLCIWFSGVYVYLSKPGMEAARTYHWMMMAFWLTASIALPQHLGHQSPFIVFLLRTLYLVSLAMLPSLFVNFLIQFPTVERAYASLIRVVAFAPGVLFSLLLVIAQTEIVFNHDRAVQRVSSSYFAVFHLYVALFLAAGLGLFAWRYRAATPVHRKQMRWVVWGITLGGLPWILFQALPLSLGVSPPFSEEVANLFTFFIPLGFGIAIARERMLDIDVVINRTVVYAIISAAVVGLYVAVTSLSTMMLGSLTQDVNVFLSAAFTIAIALFFEPAKERLQHLVDRLFSRMTYDFRIATRDLTPALTGGLTTEDLSATLMGALEKYLQLEGVVVAVQREEHRVYFAASGVVHVTAASADALIKRAADRESAVGASSETRRTGDDEFGLAVLIPIKSEFGVVVGAVGLCRKRSGQSFVPEELDFAESLLEIASVSFRRMDLLERVIFDQFEHEKLEQQHRELEMLQKMRQDLSSMIVHDLRNPLVNILLVMEELKRRIGAKIEPQEATFLTSGISAGRALLEMINDLLEIHKMEEGELQLYREKTHVEELIQGAIRHVEMLAGQKEIGLEVNTGAELPVLFVDKEKMVRVVVNILSNAIKYSGRKTQIQIVARVPKDVSVLLSIHDQGPGIPPEYIAKVFDKFVQMESQQEGKRFSTGLGLTYCKLAVEKHGGKIWAESEVGRGSTFFIEIPLQTQSLN